MRRYSIGLFIVTLCACEDSEERRNKKSTTLEKRIMSLQEVIKQSGEIKMGRKEKEKRERKGKNNNINSGKVSVDDVQTQTNFVNIDNGENSSADAVSGGDVKVSTSSILQHSASNTSFVLQHPISAPEGTASANPTKSIKIA